MAAGPDRRPEEEIIMKLRASNGSKFLRPGTYDAVVTKVEEAKSAKGQYLKWFFDVMHAGEVRTLIGASPLTLDVGSKTRAWVEAMLGRLLGDDEEVDLERLVGRPCRIDVSVNRLEDGREVNRVDRIHKRGGLVLMAKAEEPPVEEGPPEDQEGCENPF